MTLFPDCVIRRLIAPRDVMPSPPCRSIYTLNMRAFASSYCVLFGYSVLEAFAFLQRTRSERGSGVEEVRDERSAGRGNCGHHVLHGRMLLCFKIKHTKNYEYLQYKFLML